jgi:hypothetical protein
MADPVVKNNPEVATATAEMDPTGTKLLYGAGNKLWWVPIDKAQEAANQGYSPISPAQHAIISHRNEIAESPGTAFLTAAGNMALLGIPALTAAPSGQMMMREPGEPMPLGQEEMRELAEAHPIASGLGTVAGLGAGLIGGPIGAVGRGIRATGKSIAENVIAKQATSDTARMGTEAALALSAKKIFSPAANPAVMNTLQKMIDAKVIGEVAAAKTAGRILKATGPAAVLAEGAVIGATGAATDIGLMPQQEYEQMTRGDVAAKIGYDAALGAGLNGLFSLAGSFAGWGFGKAKNWLLKSAGTTSEKLAGDVSMATLTGKYVEELDSVLGDLAAKRKALEGLVAPTAKEVAYKAELDKLMTDWNTLKRAVDDGTWEKVAGKKLIDEESKAELLAQKWALLDEKIAQRAADTAAKQTERATRLQALIDTQEAEQQALAARGFGVTRAQQRAWADAKATLETKLAGEASKTGFAATEAENSMKLAQTRVTAQMSAQEKILSVLRANEHVSEVAGKDYAIQFPMYKKNLGKLTADLDNVSAGHLYDLNNTLKSRVATTTAAIGNAVPGAAYIGKGMTSLALGGIGYVSTGGDPLTTVIGVVAPWAATWAAKQGAKLAHKEIFRTSFGKWLAENLPAAPGAAWKFIGNMAASQADAVLKIMSDDEKHAELDRLRMMNSPRNVEHLAAGLQQAGYDPAVAAATAEARSKEADLLLSHKDDNRVSYSKLSFAVKQPLGAIGRIAKGKLIKEDAIMLKALYPEAWNALQLSAKRLSGEAKASDLSKTMYKTLRPLWQGTGAKAMMSAQIPPSKPKVGNIGGGKLGGAGSLLTQGQNLQVIGTAGRKR